MRVEFAVCRLIGFLDPLYVFDYVYREKGIDINDSGVADETEYRLLVALCRTDLYVLLKKSFFELTDLILVCVLL